MYHNDILLTCVKHSRNFSYFEILNYTFKKQPSDCSIKKGVLKNFTKFTRKHLCQSLYFDKVACCRTQACNVIKKQTPTQAFSGEFCEIFKSTFFTEHFRATATDISEKPFYQKYNEWWYSVWLFSPIVMLWHQVSIYVVQQY